MVSILVSIYPEHLRTHRYKPAVIYRTILLLRTGEITRNVVRDREVGCSNHLAPTNLLVAKRDSF